MVDIFIKNKKLDLFKDEKIKLVSKLNDIENLSNIYTDFTQSFTIPASDNNNNIFKHYYNLNIDNTFLINKRVSAYIEFNTLPFKSGNIQLESVNVKNGLAYSYTITFYGDLKQLTDLFGDDTIDLLDYDKYGTKQWDGLSRFDIEWSEDNFKYLFFYDDWIGMNGDVIIPLINSGYDEGDDSYDVRPWQYGWNSNPGEDKWDISNSDYPIMSDEVRLALRNIRIIEAIELKYGLEFSRDFFGKATFNNLFMWLNNLEQFKLSATDIYFTNPFDGINVNDNFTNDLPFLSATRNLESDIVNYNGYHSYNISYILSYEFVITPSDPTIKYDIYGINLDGDIIDSRLYIDDVQNFDIDYYSYIGGSGTQREHVKLSIVTYGNVDFNIDVRVYYRRELSSSVDEVYIDVNSSVNVTIDQYLKIEQNIPKIKVIDYLQGLMKMFKLIIIPTGDNKLYINTLDDYYLDGDIINMNEYIDVSDENIKRPMIYSDISFNYEKTNNIMGKLYREENDPIFDKTGYGDLSAQFDIDDDRKLDVKLPFENMLFDRLITKDSGDLTDITIGQSITSDDNIEFKKNKSKPILFFNNGISDIHPSPIYVQFSRYTSPIKTDWVYNIGNTNDKLLGQVYDTINFGSEIDPWHKELITPSLYKNYWENYIKEIYDDKQRKLSLKSFNIPPSIINKLSLNDKLIVGDNLYKINDYEIELTTGDVSFNLFYDRQIEYNKLEVYPPEIIGNLGYKYYRFDINIDDDIYWNIEKIVGTPSNMDWLNIINKEGYGRSEITFTMDAFPTTTPRTCDLEIYIDGHTYSVSVSQES